MQYLAIARGTTVLAEHSNARNARNVVLGSLEHVAASPEARTNVTSDGFNVVYLKREPYVFAAAAAADSSSRALPLAAAERAATEWASSGCAETGARAAAHSLDRAFGPQLRRIVSDLNARPETADRVAALQSKVDGTRGVMLHNIDSVIARGERLENLRDRTEELAQASAAFKKQGQALRRDMWCAGVKVKALIFGSVALILAVIIVIVACTAGGTNRCLIKKAGA